MIYTEDLVAAALLKRADVKSNRSFTDKISQLADVTDEDRHLLTDYFGGVRDGVDGMTPIGDAYVVAENLNFLATAELADSFTNDSGLPLDDFQKWVDNGQGPMPAEESVLGQSDMYFNIQGNNEVWMDKLAAAYQVEYTDAESLIEAVNTAIAVRIAESYMVGDGTLLKEITDILERDDD